MKKWSAVVPPLALPLCGALIGEGSFIIRIDDPEAGLGRETDNLKA